MGARASGGIVEGRGLPYLLTSGAITRRVAHLERNGWVRRNPDPGDRRQIFVTLTDEGLKRTTRAFGIVSKTENALLGWLGDEALGRMNDDLRELLLNLEGPASTTP